MKNCGNKDCKQVNPQPLAEFCKNKYGKDGLRSTCRSCDNARNKIYHDNNREKVAKWRKQWDQNNPESRRNLSLKNKHGINTQIYDSMLSDQNNCCAICGIHQDKLNKRLAVDHNHITGKIRGLLCDDCNKALGLLKDDLQSLEEAIKYLKRE